MSKLTKIKRKNLEVDKYSRALRAAVNYRVYAEVWYLDVLTDKKWECWVYGDYEVIMPIPIQKKFGIKMVAQPIYCQQLGVFYRQEIPEELFRNFEGKLHQYLVRAYHFNEENTETYQPKGTIRFNYLLSLQPSFEVLNEGFERDRKKDIRRNQKLGWRLDKEARLMDYLDLLKTDYADLVDQVEVEYTQACFEEAIKNQALGFYSLFDEQDRICSTCLFLESRNRKILIASARNKSFEKKGMQAYMLSLFMEEMAGTKTWLDFEGSMIKGIADYNKSFGAIPKAYTAFKNLPKF